MVTTSSSGIVISKASSSAMTSRMCFSESQLATVSVLVSGPMRPGSTSNTAPMVSRSLSSAIIYYLDVRGGRQLQLTQRGAIAPLPLGIRRERQAEPVVEVAHLGILGGGEILGPNH